MDRNELMEIIKQAAGTKTTTLDLQDRGLSELPSLIGEVTNISRLILRGNKLASLPKELFTLTDLRELDLGHNQLTRLPPEIGRLKNLERLDLSGNKLAALPPELAQLSKLNFLDLNDNELPIPSRILANKNNPGQIITALQDRPGMRLYYEAEAKALSERVVTVLQEIGFAGVRPEWWSDAKENSDSWLPQITGGFNAIYYGSEREADAVKIQKALQSLDPPVYIERKAEGPLWGPGYSSNEIKPQEIYLMFVGEVFPLTYQDNFNFSRNAQRVLEGATNMLDNSKFNVATTGDLLLSLAGHNEWVEAGGDDPDYTTTGTSHFLADYITGALPKSGSELKLADERRQFANISSWERSQAKSAPDGKWMISAELAGVLNRAREYAQRTGDNGEIHSRHLLAALLYERPEGPPNDARQWLSQKSIDRDNMCADFLAFMQRQGYPVSEWNRLLLGEAPDITQLIGYSPDDVHQEKDLIGIDREVTAFARLIAARTVPPPLAIGLFGEWGSGKTFFMRMMRDKIDKLAAWAANQEKMQRDLPYYKRIVQIEFNAWHYVEGNLWASLVQHIFDNLSLAGERENAISERLQKHLIEKLGQEEREEQRARAAEQEALNALKETQQELDNIRDEIDKQTSELAAVAAEQALRNFALDSLREPINALLSTLGLQAVSDSARDLELALDEAQDVLEQGSGLLTPILQAEDRDKRFASLIAVVIGSLLLGFLVAMFTTWLNSKTGQAFSQTVAAFGSSIAAFLTTGAAWIRSQARWVNERLTKIAEQRQKLEHELNKKLQEKTEAANKLEKRLQTLNVEYNAAQRKNATAQQRLQSAREELAKATSASLLEGYIKSRALSNVYRDHLGIPAIIRQDFETLSGLMEEENWKLDPPVETDRRPRWKSKKYNSLVEERLEEEQRINRIVLYIDDLDRCPPNRVVDVLQAIHLLLAFPLFVVVVGVDARWITRSLEARYRALLHAEDGLKTDMITAELFGKATTEDYLEKIFQIPYWLRPLDETAAQGMIRGLLPSETREKGGQTDLHQPGGSSQDDESTVETGQEDEPVEPDDETKEDDSPSTSSPAAEGTHADQPIQPTVANEVTEDEAHEEEEDPDPAVLDISLEERNYIEKLTPLLGRSPRALKRFINVYRLIKAGLSAYELRLFLREHAVMSGYQAVLLLLAIDTGVPDIAPDFFQTLRAGAEANHAIRPTLTAEEGPGELKGLPWLIKQLDDGEETRENEEWPRLKSWLATTEDNSGVPLASSTAELIFLDSMAGRVVRHSFRVNYQ